MLFIALPTIGLTLAAFVATAVAAFAVGSTVAKKRTQPPIYHDPETAFRELRAKINHPVRRAYHSATRWLR